jgi:glycosyltransferase involved in cell wall biosynthesis
LKYPKVSIVIPVYNAADFLQQSITSLLQQTYPNKEIIIVDDSSSDNSYNIAKTFECKSVKVLRQPNSGASVARNTGFAHATGDYIQFMDVDDFLSSDKIEKQVKWLEGASNKVAVCDYVEFTDTDDLKNLVAKEYLREFIYTTNEPAKLLINLLGGNGKESFIQTNCWLLPRQLVSTVGGWRNYRSVDDDGEFFTRIALACEGIIYVKGVLVYYRRTGSSSSLSNSRQYHLLRNMLLTIDLKYSYISKHSSSPNLNKAFAKQYLNYAVYNYPEQKKLSAIAYRKYKRLKCKVNPPKLGGTVVEMVSKVLGWRFTRKIKYILSARKLLV